MNLGAALRHVRQVIVERRQGQVAKAVGISQTYLSQIESGKKVPAQEVVESICKEYKVPIAIVVWMSLESSDVDRRKRDAFSKIKPIVDDLIKGFLINNYLKK